MEETLVYLFSLFSIVSLLLLISKFLILSKQRKCRNLPPTPPSLPIIGHLHLLKEPMHRVFHQLSCKYGAIFALRFGSRPVLVISSPSLVQECFIKNDVILANRPRFLIGKYLDYEYTTIGAASYGNLWRNLRRVATLQLFSTTRLNTYMGIRQDEVRSLIKHLFRDACQGFASVEMKSRMRNLTFNIIMMIVAGKRYFGAEVEELEEAANFRKIISEVFQLSGASNPGDFLPFLRWIDFQSLEKRLAKIKAKSDDFSQRLIDEHRNKDQVSYPDGAKTKTLIESMLSLQESDPEYYTDDIIKGMILTMLIAGTDTSALTMEWAMSLLLNHPNALEKARDEIDEYVGQNRLVEEADLPKLRYLQSIVNETLRLFPAGPLLVPHESSDECTIGGYNLSPGTIILVNAWAIHRDPKLWDDPTSFRPERFESMGSIEDYRFIPFGMGRRQCPGAGLANRVVVLALASLIQCFEWKRVSEELVDLSERKGLTMPKEKPLEAMCKARERMINVITEL